MDYTKTDKRQPIIAEQDQEIPGQPGAWPVELIEIGGFIYSKEQAIAQIGLPPFGLQSPVVRNCWRIWFGSRPDEEAVICR